MSSQPEPMTLRGKTLSPRKLVAGNPSRLRNGINTLRQHSLPLLWHVLPRDALRLVPGSSMRFGPPRLTATWSEFRQNPGVTWHTVYPERAETLPRPFFCNHPSEVIAAGRHVVWPESGVAQIAGGRVLDDDAWVVGADDTYLADFCYFGSSRFSRVNQIFMLQRPRHLPGRTLNLASANSATNFFHVLIDSISRIHLVREANYTWKDFDQILFPRFSSPTVEMLVDLTGLPREKLIRIGRREQFFCETLIQPSFPGPLACTPSWVSEFYRALFPPTTQPRTRRLYFPRHGNRHPANEAALAARLSEEGFETADPMRTPDLRERLAEASHVVGVHGASLGNLVFCAPGTRVLELMPTEISAHYNRWFYYTLCATGRMPYGVVIGRSRAQRLTSFSPQPKTSFDVDPADFDRALTALLSP